MDNNVKLEFLGTVLKLLSRYEALTPAQIAHKTRAMRRPRRIPSTAVFGIMENFVEGDLIKRVLMRSRIMYTAKIQNTLSDIANASKGESGYIGAFPKPIHGDMKAALIEHGAVDMDALTAGIKERAIQFQQKRDEEKKASE